MNDCFNGKLVGKQTSPMSHGTGINKMCIYIYQHVRVYI